MVQELMVQGYGSEAANFDRIFIMIKNCKKCSLELTENNWIVLRRGTIRGVCKKCRSEQVMQYNKSLGEKRRIYVREYIRKIGRVKQYPCETCKSLCYKKYARAFCSEKCRFMFYVICTGSCWIWKGASNKRGYGFLCYKDKKHEGAHRVSYKLFKGDIPEGMCVCHNCPGGDNPSCVNPDHLWLGTTQENAKDMVEKNRSLRGEKHIKSKVTEADVIAIRKMNLLGIAQIKIAQVFGLTSGHLNNIIKKRAWKHI